MKNRLIMILLFVLKIGGSINLNTKIWDISALFLIISEAGRDMTDMNGNKLKCSLDNRIIGTNFGVIARFEKLLTNDEILAANQNAEHSRQLFRKEGKVAWGSNVSGSRDTYLAIFNLDEHTEELSVLFSSLGIENDCKIRNLWQQKNMGVFKEKFAETVNAHSAKIFKMSQVIK